MNQNIVDKLNEHFSKYEIKKYKKGQMITLANEEPTGVSLLLNGTVEQYDITPEGNKITVNVFKPPSFFPMSWAINKTPNTYFFSALTEVGLRQADADKTLDFLRNNPDVMLDLLSRVYKGTDGLLKKLTLAATGMAANKLIFELLTEAYRFGEEVDNNSSFINIKQSVLAARSGLARETVSRELNKLEQESLVSRVEKGLIINIRELEKKLDFKK